MPNPLKEAEAALDDPSHVSFDDTAYPPMLCAALNEPMPPYPEPNPGSFATYSSVEMGTILRWIAARLNGGIDDVWNTPAGNPGNAFDPTTLEEQWARGISELMFGVKYNGQPGATSLGWDSSGFDEYIFRRLTPSFGGEPQRDAQQNLMTKPSGRLDFGANEYAGNTDPASGLLAACQQLSTYALVTRGFDWNSLFGGWELGASRSTASKPMFKNGGGLWEPGHVTPHDIHDQSGLDAYLQNEQPGINAMLSVANAKNATGFGPGAIYVFDPDLWFKNVPFPLYQLPDDTTATPPPKPVGGAKEGPWTWGTLPRINDERLLQILREQRDGKPTRFDPIQYHLFLLHERARGNKIWMQSAYSSPQRPDRGLRDDLTVDEKRQLANNPDNPPAELCDAGKLARNAGVAKPFTWALGREQRDGSHVECVLRSSPDGQRVQLLNTWISLTYVQPDLAQLRARLLVAGRGLTTIGDSSFGSQVGGPDYFVGLGIPDPASVSLGAAIDAMKRARPVGLVRLALRRRNPPKGSDGVITITRVIPMWGLGPTQNYTIPRLIWSLRDMPGREDLEAVWLIHFPTNNLAWKLWPSGGRAVTADAIAAEEANVKNMAPTKIARSNELSAFAALVLYRVVYNSHAGQCVLADPEDGHVLSLCERAATMKWGERYVAPDVSGGAWDGDFDPNNPPGPRRVGTPSLFKPPIPPSPPDDGPRDAGVPGGVDFD